MNCVFVDETVSATITQACGPDCRARCVRCPMHSTSRCQSPVKAASLSASPLTEGEWASELIGLGCHMHHFDN